MPLDPESVPPSARQLLALVDTWAVGDDADRDRLVKAATSDQLVDLVAAVDAAGPDFWGWLSGPASLAKDPSVEYIRLTDLTMAADAARLTLARRAKERE